jgi:hypothetical protein
MLKDIIVYWLPLPFIATANGMLREFVTKKYMSELAANQVSVGTAIILFFIYCLIVKDKIGLSSLNDALLCGAVWIVMTVIFEFGLGFVSGKPVDLILAEYNIFKGRLWPLVLLFTGLMPLIMYKLKA